MTPRQAQMCDDTFDQNQNVGETDSMATIPQLTSDSRQAAASTPALDQINFNKFVGESMSQSSFSGDQSH